MANWVKFLRGTFSQYDALPTKEQDTLYFVYSEDGKECALYLGNRLVSGNGTIDGATSFDELNDVLIQSVADKHLLQYDASKSQWVNISFEEVINQIKEKLPTPTSFITSVNDINFSVDEGKLNLKPVSISQVDNLQNVLDNKVEKVEGSRLINQEEIAALRAVIDGQSGEFSNFIKAVDTEVFNVEAETGKLELVAVPARALTAVLGDVTTLPGYAENPNNTIIEEINNIYTILSWQNIEEVTSNG